MREIIFKTRVNQDATMARLKAWQSVLSTPSPSPSYIARTLSQTAALLYCRFSTKLNRPRWCELRTIMLETPPHRRAA